MFRKRIVAVWIATSAALAGGVFVPRSASAQEVLNLDEDAPAKGDAKKGGQKGVDIDLDEGQGGGKAAQAPVTAGQPTEAFAAADRKSVV